MQPVIVVVDGRGFANAALDLAVEEAALRGAAVHVLCVWEFPPMLDPTAACAQGAFAVFGERARATLVEALDGVAARNPLIRRTGSIADGHNASVFLSATNGASLIIVSLSRRKRFTGVFRNSVSEWLLRRANCPVAVVHDAG